MRNILRIGLVFAFRDGDIVPCARDTKRALSPLESMQMMQELAEIRARLLRDNSLKRPKR
jgi:hypothetical protein